MFKVTQNLTKIYGLSVCGFANFNTLKLRNKKLFACGTFKKNEPAFIFVSDCVDESKNTQNKDSCQEISQCVVYSNETLHHVEISEISEISRNPGQHSNLTGEDENARRAPKTVLLEGSSLSQVEFSRAVEISEHEISLVREEDVGEGQEVEGDEHEEEEEDRQGIHSIADLTPIKL